MLELYSTSLWYYNNQSIRKKAIVYALSHTGLFNNSTIMSIGFGRNVRIQEKIRINIKLGNRFLLRLYLNIKARDGNLWTWDGIPVKLYSIKPSALESRFVSSVVLQTQVSVKTTQTLGVIIIHRAFTPIDYFY